MRARALLGEHVLRVFPLQLETFNSIKFDVDPLGYWIENLWTILQILSLPNISLFPTLVTDNPTFMTKSLAQQSSSILKHFEIGIPISRHFPFLGPFRRMENANSDLLEFLEVWNDFLGGSSEANVRTRDYQS